MDSYRHDPELMKVIIVEVTRAANSFGAAHLGKITEAYRLIAGIVARGAASGRVPRDDRRAEFAAMAFYGAIEQVLTGWIFGVLDEDDGALRPGEGLHRRDDLRRPRRTRHLDCRAMTDNEMVKRLMWSGLLAGIGALASVATTRVAAMIWRRAFGEDPPE